MPPRLYRKMRDTGVSQDKVRRIYRIIRYHDRADNPDLFPAAAAWAASCYNPPETWEIILHAADEILGTYGVEGFEALQGEEVLYCNNGDTYRPTLCYFRAGWRWCGWGDLAEKYGSH